MRLLLLWSRVAVFLQIQAYAQENVMIAQRLARTRRTEDVVEVAHTASRTSDGQWLAWNFCLGRLRSRHEASAPARFTCGTVANAVPVAAESKRGVWIFFLKVVLNGFVVGFLVA